MNNGLDFETAAMLTDLPMKLLRKMHREYIIEEPVGDMELRGLAMIRDVWHREWFLRMALSYFSHARRLELIQKPELTRVERYILKFYLNAREGERIGIIDGISLVDHFFKTKVTPKQVRRIRSMAYEIRRGRSSESQSEAYLWKTGGTFLEITNRFVWNTGN